MRSGRRLQSRGVRLAVVAVFAALPLACVEALLLLEVVRLPESAARYVFGYYEPSQPRRYVHTRITPLGVGLHRPGFVGSCYFEGYAWRHESDAFGWRNPETWDTAAAVVLGDSMIYGHGVEEEQTTTHFMRELSGQTVVNLGLTGGSPVHYLANLRNFGLPLRPRVAVVLFFGNDLDDIRAMRSPEAVQRFIDTGEGAETQVISREELITRLRLPGKQRPDVLDVFATYRLLQFAMRSRGLLAYEGGAMARDARLADRQPTDVAPRAAPRGERVRELEGAYKREVDYLRRAVTLMAESSRATGTALVVGNLGARQPRDLLIERRLQELSLELGLHYFDDTPVLDGRHRLRRDGHLNEAGHRRLAERLVAFLDAERLW